MERSEMMRRLSVLKEAAGYGLGLVGPWIYDAWLRLNDELWGGELEPGIIHFGLTPHGKSFGFYDSRRNLITLHQGIVYGSLNEPEHQDADGVLRTGPWRLGGQRGYLFAIDVLIQQMVRQHGYQSQQLTDNSNRKALQLYLCHENNRLRKPLNCTEGYYFSPLKRTKRKKVNPLNNEPILDENGKEIYENVYIAEWNWEEKTMPKGLRGDLPAPQGYVYIFPRCLRGKGYYYRDIDPERILDIPLSELFEENPLAVNMKDIERLFVPRFRKNRLNP